MNSHDMQQQEKLQAAAERAERDGSPAGNPQVDAYRLVLRALKTPLPIGLPADFAQQVARRLQVRDEAAGLERWLTSILLVTMAIAAAWFALPPMAAAIAPVLRATTGQSMPWAWMSVAGIGMAAVWLADVALSARQHKAL
jgi:hypothetical protein